MRYRAARKIGTTTSAANTAPAFPGVKFFDEQRRRAGLGCPGAASRSTRHADPGRDRPLLTVAAPAGAAAPAKVRPCRLLKQSEITTVFAMEASRGSAMGSDCTWQLGDLALSLEVTTSDAKATYDSLRDLAEDAGSNPVKVKGIRDQAVFAEIPSFKELLVFKGKTFLFLRLLDIQSTVDAGTAQTAMTQLGKAAVKRV